MKLAISRNRFEEKIFLIGYFCILMAFLFTCTTYPNNYDSINLLTRTLRIWGYGFLVLKILLNFKTNKKQLFFMIVTVSSALIVTYITDSITIITDILVIISANNVNFRKIVKLDVIIRSIFLCFTFISFYLGIIPEAIDYRNWVEIRHSLGFAHPNRLALHIFIIFLYFFYLQKGKIKLGGNVFLLIVLILTYKISGGRTACIGMSVILLIGLWNCFFKKYKIENFLKKNASILYKLVLGIAVTISIVFPILSIRGIIEYNGTTISSRIVLAGKALASYGLSIWGQKIQIIGTLEARRQGVASNAIDNAYVYVLVNYGVIVFFVILLLFIAAMNMARRKRDWIGLICVMLLVVLLVLENQFINIESNLFLIFAGYILVGVNTEWRNTD